MQSGISVTSELHDAFTAFSTDTSLFCLPITITSEALTSESPIPFTSQSFYASLPQLSSILKPQTPQYLLFRRDDSSLVALTYIPSNAPVRAKTLFASTRATLVRELGSEKFATTIFATEEEEVVSEAAWKERDAESSRKTAGGSGEREDLMDAKERELASVRRAEEETRSSTAGRDIGIGGARGNGLAGSTMKVQMPIDDDALEALKGLQPGSLVQLGIDIPTETLKLASSESGVDPNSVQSQISPSVPRYSYYHYPDSDAIIFAYTCPSGASIKERMVYASSRNNAYYLAVDNGLKISKKLEASSPDEISGDRLHEEVYPPQNQGTSRGFARPKRPGR